MRGLVYRRLILLASAIFSPALACSGGEDASVPGADADAAASDGAPSGSDATRDEMSDAGSDATVDADADAESRICSLDGFCHTQVPPNSVFRDLRLGGGTVFAIAWMNGPADPWGQRKALGGSLLRWDGATWKTDHTEPGRLNAIWGSSPTDLWIGGDDGLFHATGTSPESLDWTKVRSEPVTSIWGSGPNDVWAVGGGSIWSDNFAGKVLHYSGPAADGDGWEIDPISSSTQMSFAKVWGTSPSDVWIGGVERTPDFLSYARVLRRRPDGNGGIAFSANAMPPIGAAGYGEGSEVTGAGLIGSHVWVLGYMTDGNGVPNVWDVQFQGTPKTDGSGDFDWQRGTWGTCSFGCRGVVSARAVWGTNPNDAYVVGDNGYVRHWNGTSFSTVRITITQLPVTASFRAIAGTSNTDIWIVGDGIALHKSGSNKP